LPTQTYVPLANLTLSTSQATVTFSSIGQGYADLVFVFAGSCLTGAADFYIRFNGDTGSSYDRWFMQGNGSSTESFGNANDTPLRVSRAVLAPGETTNYIMNVMDYSATNKNKNVLIRGNNAARSTEAFTGRYATNTAITSITLLLGGGYSFAAGSSFALYGISA